MSMRIHAVHSLPALFTAALFVTTTPADPDLGPPPRYSLATCDATDPLNEGCCESDVKAMYIALSDGITVTGVSTTPNISPSFAPTPKGVKVC